MASFSAMCSFNCSVLGHSNGNPMLAFRNQTSPREAKDLVKCQFMPKWIRRSKTKSLYMERGEPRFVVSGGGSYGGMKNDDEYKQDSFWLELCKDISYMTRSLKTFFTFLAEQPGQFKYLEWPTFQHTLRTATLTLVLVAALIVALSSIDFALAYVLALLTRKPA